MDLELHGIIRGASVKSVQYGVVTLTTTLPTVTINAVDTSSAIVLVSVYCGQNAAAKDICTFAYLDSATQLKFHRNDPDSYNVTVAWQVVEFNNIKSLQKGSKSGSGAVTISAVDVEKTVVISEGKSSVSTSTTANTLTQVCYLTSSTELTVMAGGGANDSIHYQVIEFR